MMTERYNISSSPSFLTHPLLSPYLNLMAKMNFNGSSRVLYVVTFGGFDHFCWIFNKKCLFESPQIRVQCQGENLLSKQLEWNSMKNLVFDLVSRVATQFMIWIPPSGSLFGSERRRETALQQITPQQPRCPFGDHTLLGNKLRGYSNLKRCKNRWMVTCHDVSGTPCKFENSI